MMGRHVFGSQWDKAEAKIVARDAKFSGDGSVAKYTYVADIRLPSGETFRATILEPTIATDFWGPNIGDEVSVLVKAKDRKVKFDKDDPRMSVKAYDAAKKKALEDVQNQPAGTSPATPYTSTQIPDAVAAQLAQLGIVAGAQAQVFTAGSPEAQAAMAAFTQPAAAAVPTPEARLAKLQSMRESGLLTDDEYAQQRQRILDEI